MYSINTGFNKIIRFLAKNKRARVIIFSLFFVITVNEKKKLLSIRVPKVSFAAVFWDVHCVTSQKRAGKETKFPMLCAITDRDLCDVQVKQGSKLTSTPTGQMCDQIFGCLSKKSCVVAQLHLKRQSTVTVQLLYCFIT